MSTQSNMGRSGSQPIRAAISKPWTSSFRRAGLTISSGLTRVASGTTSTSIVPTSAVPGNCRTWRPPIGSNEDESSRPDTCMVARLRTGPTATSCRTTRLSPTKTFRNMAAASGSGSTENTLAEGKQCLAIRANWPRFAPMSTTLSHLRPRIADSCSILGATRQPSARIHRDSPATRIRSSFRPLTKAGRHISEAFRLHARTHGEG